MAVRSGLFSTALGNITTPPNKKSAPNTFFGVGVLCTL